MMNKSQFFTVTLFALSSSALSAQNPTTAGGFGGSTGGNVAVTRDCNASAYANSLGFSFAARLSRGLSTAQAGAGGGSGSAGFGQGSYTPTTSSMVYSEEPLVGAVSKDGPADGKIQAGDLIARVNGYAITTAEGSEALRSAKPGSSLIITVRRGENLIPVTIIPNAGRCPMMLGGTYARSGNGAVTLTPGGSVAGVVGTTVAQGTAVAGFGSTVALTPSTKAGLSAGATGVYRTSVNTGWLGMGFDCSDCGQRFSGSTRAWYFSQPPLIYNVDTGSPAYNAGIRRGDILLRVDGKDVTSAAAGARLGAVKPGEKLNLTYRRAGKSKDVSVVVAPSPIAMRASTVTGQLLPLTREIRSSATESQIRELISQTERAKVAQEANIRQLEQALKSSQGASTEDARVALNKLRATQELQARNQKELLSKVLENEQNGARKLNLLEQQVARAAVEAQAPVVELMVDSAVPSVKAASRDQRLRYSGTVGNADIDVRGPGSVNVQRDGDDLIIVTGDAIIRIKAHKSK